MAKKESKPDPIVSGTQLWVMALTGHTPAGGFHHVSPEGKLYTSPGACQRAIDEMEGWIGMGDRKRYHPLPLIVN